MKIYWKSKKIYKRASKHRVASAGIAKRNQFRHRTCSSRHHRLALSLTFAFCLFFTFDPACLPLLTLSLCQCSSSAAFSFASSKPLIFAFYWGGI